MQGIKYQVDGRNIGLTVLYNMLNLVNNDIAYLKIAESEFQIFSHKG